MDFVTDSLQFCPYTEVGVPLEKGLDEEYLRVRTFVRYCMIALVPIRTIEKYMKATETTNVCFVDTLPECYS